MWKKHTNVSSVLALVKIVVASQHKRQRKKSLSRVVDNWKHRLGLQSQCTRCTMQMSYCYTSDLPFKNFCKLSKQAETIKNRFRLRLSIVWETRKLTLYQPGVKSFLTQLFSTEHLQKLTRYALISGHPGGLTPGNPRTFVPRHSQIPPTQGQVFLHKKLPLALPRGAEFEKKIVP